MSGLTEVVESIFVTINSVPVDGGVEPQWLPALRWIVDKILPPALLAIAVSWAIPRSLERWKGRREHFYKTVDILRAQLQLLQFEASSYWLARYDKKVSPVQEERIEFLLGDVTKLVRLAAKSGAPSLYKDSEAPAVLALASLADAATGGDFRSPRRVADPNRSRAVTTASLHLLSLLADERWSFVSNASR